MLSAKWDTHIAVVLAAHGLGAAAVAAAADDADGRAVKTPEDIDALHNDPEQAQEKASAGVGGLYDG